MTTTPAAARLARDLCERLHLEYLPLDWLRFTGDPLHVVNSSFHVGTMAQTTIGLAGLSAAYYHSLISDHPTFVSVDARHAAIEFSLYNLPVYFTEADCSSESEAYHLVNRQRDTSLWNPLAGRYKTKGGHHIAIHTNFPHHRDGILKILHCGEDRAEVKAALQTWDAFDFETEAARQGMCIAVARSLKEWQEHPHSRALRDVPPLQIIKRGEAPTRQIKDIPEAPLGGIKVLDLTRVLAGPICGRTLASYGAEVSWVTSPLLPNLPLLDADTSRGKHALSLDLTTEEDRSRLKTLTEDSDVFLQAYRPGGLAAKGFGVDDLIRMRPGIICANITAYGYEGPWKDRRGFDSLVQTATGIIHDEGAAYKSLEENWDAPDLLPLPMQALDHATAYLTTLGINIALAKTLTEGGSWEVRTSLAAVGQWLRSLGRINPEVAFRKAQALPQSSVPMPQEIQDLSEEAIAANGDTVVGVKHAAIFSNTK